MSGGLGGAPRGVAGFVGEPALCIGGGREKRGPEVGVVAVRSSEGRVAELVAICVETGKRGLQKRGGGASGRLAFVGGGAFGRLRYGDYFADGGMSRKASPWKGRGRHGQRAPV